MSREAGVIIPKSIGQAVSIVGVLVIGESAVNARLISAPMVIVTVLTGISSFLIPSLFSIVIIRFIFLLPRSFLGFYGYFFAVMFLLIYLMSMTSFGVIYILKIATGPIKLEDIKDTVIRVPWWMMNKRPKELTGNVIRSIFVKITICIIGACKGITYLFRIKDYKYIVIPVTLIMLTLSITLYDNTEEMLDWAFKVWTYYSVPFELIFP